MTEQNQPGETGPEPSPPPPTFEQRMERFGQEVDEAGQRLGRSAEEAGRRLAANPTVADAADTAARVWGLIVLAIGVWFFAQVTLHYDLPSIPLGDLWPIALIGLGLLVIGRGMLRRRT